MPLQCRRHFGSALTTTTCRSMRAYELAAAIPGCELIEMKGEGHLGWHWTMTACSAGSRPSEKARSKPRLCRELCRLAVGPARDRPFWQAISDPGCPEATASRALARRSGAFTRGTSPPPSGRLPKASSAASAHVASRDGSSSAALPMRSPLQGPLSGESRCPLCYAFRPFAPELPRLPQTRIDGDCCR